MKLNRLAAGVAVLALSVGPGIALADSGNGNGPPTSVPPNNQGTAHNPNGTGTNTPGPNASLPAKAKAYGKYCQGESKKHVAGTPGTPFSKCVTDMAKLAHGQATTPTSACKNESRKHISGQHGTPYSLCVSGATGSSVAQPIPAICPPSATKALPSTSPSRSATRCVNPSAARNSRTL